VTHLVTTVSKKTLLNIPLKLAVGIYCETPEYETCVNHNTGTAELTVAFGEDGNTRK